MVIKAHTESGRRAITKLILFSDLDVAVLSGDDCLLIGAGRKIFFLLLVGHHG
jgi:hypothetical protein